MKDNAKLRILFLAKAFPPQTGGVETYSEQVALAYAKMGHDVTVLTAHPGSRGQEKRGDITVINVGQGGQLGVFARLFKNLWALRSESFDMAHATTWRVALPLMLLRRSLRLVLTVHGREVFVVPTPLRPLMYRAMRRAELIPTVSQPILDMFQQRLPFPLQGAFANWNGISFEDECSSPHNKPGALTISCMCRLVERKNIATAIKAVAELIREGYDVRYVIAGSGPEFDSLKMLVDQEDMAERITLLGRIPDEDIVPFYRKSHIFLHPQIAARDGQDMEGFGLTIADAMSFGCVPIAGASGGPMDFIASGQTGFLVDGEDQSAIVSALKQVLDSDQTRKKISAATQDFACKNLTWNMHAANILEKLNAD